MILNCNCKQVSNAGGKKIEKFFFKNERLFAMMFISQTFFNFREINSNVSIWLLC